MHALPPGPARLSPINQRRLANFKANRRGFWSFWIFLTLFFVSLGLSLPAQARPGMDGPGWAHPVVVNGRLYLRHSDYLFCYDIKNK